MKRIMSLKQIVSLILFAILVLATVSCSKQDTDKLADSGQKAMPDVSDSGQEAVPGVSDSAGQNEPSAEAADPAHFIEDIDYMIYVLENNFALFDVAYWARGVDILALAENAREASLREEDLSISDFHHILSSAFEPLNGIGHFAIQGYYYIGITDDFDDPRLELILSMDKDQLQEFLDIIAKEVGQEHADRMAGFIDAGDYAGMVWLMNLLNNMPRNDRTENIKTEIIEESKTAYISIDSFMRLSGSQEWRDDERQITQFYDEISDYEHLIIDLRNNAGGYLNYVLDLLIRPLIKSEISVDAYYFTIHGEYAAKMTSSPLKIVNDGFSPVDKELRPIIEMLEAYDLPELNMADMERMVYGYRAQVNAKPRKLPGLESHPAFEGNIWLLTSGMSVSAAQMAAWIMKDAGIATLVGDTTGGVFGGTSRTTVTLPNSGLQFEFDVFYITDRYGRPLEAGTQPHHFCRPGMDALETTLALISEG